MLARVPSAVLERLRLPLGDATKAAVRAEAAAAGMAAATARESQDVCFLGGGALDDFLAREGVQLAAGSIRDEAGEELGRHAGAVAYTPGQRRGLGVAAAAPLYVLRADAARNELVVGPRSRLACSEVLLRDVRLDEGDGPRARQAARALAHGRGASSSGCPRGCACCSTSRSTASRRTDRGALRRRRSVVGSGVIAPALPMA